MNSLDILQAQIKELQRQNQELRRAIDSIPRRPVFKSGTWTPTFSGFSVDPSGLNCRYYLINDLVHCFIRCGTPGTSNATNFYMSAPFQSKSVTTLVYIGVAFVMDNGSYISSPGRIQIGSLSQTFTLYSLYNGTTWTASGSKTCDRAYICYEINS